MMLRYSSLAVFLSLPIGSFADDAAALKKIDQAIEEARKRYYVPGASIAIVKDDKVIFAKGFGYRDVEKRLPATPNTLYCIGSSTKAFTGLLVALSAQEGKLALTDSPAKYIPEFRLKDEEAAKKIQVIDLLTHRSGLPRTDIAWYSGRFDRNDIIQMLPEFEPTAKLGQKWQYQNVMFMVAGEIAGRANGTSYDELLREKLFSPLGMQMTNSTYAAWQASKETAQGYGQAGKWTSKSPLPYRVIDTAGPAGSINSNVVDMAQWLRLQLNKGSVDGKQIAKPETIDETWKPRIEMIPGSGTSYGFGWMLRKWNETPLIEHGGNIDGYNAQVAFLPEKKIGFVMLTNVSASPLPSQAIDIVFSELVGKPEQKATAATSTYKAADDVEMGAYDLAIAKTTLVFSKDKSQVVMDQSGIKVPLRLVADKTYEPVPANAPKFRITFRASEKDPKQTEVLLEQSGMKFTLPKVPPYTAPMQGEELLAKVVAARGGADAIRKQRHLVSKFTARMLSDGITVRGYEYAKDGDKHAQFAVFFALNRRFAWAHEFADGKVAYDTVSFVQPSSKTGSDLYSSLNAANIEMDLAPFRYYKSLRIVKEEKVGDEEVYVLEKTPKAGATITEHISKTTFLPLKRSMGPSSTAFEDYRDVEGLKLPFKQTVETPESGKLIVTIDSVSFTDPIPGWVFRFVPDKR